MTLHHAVASRVPLLLLYALCVGIAFECTARLLFIIPAIATRLYGDDDVTWRQRWVARHRRGVASYHSFDMFDPTKGWISKPNLRDMEVFGGKRLNTTSRGLRGRREYAYGYHSGTTRILTLGDSFTFGDEVSDDETYSAYLQDMIPSAEIINMGVHGYGHDQMLILLNEEGLRYRPDIVILGFVAMDMSRNVLRFRDYAKPKFVLDHGALVLVGSPVPRPEDILKWHWARPRLYDVWSLFENRLLMVSGRYQSQVEAVTTALLDEILRSIHKAGARPLFVYLPDGQDLDDRRRVTTRENFLLSYCRARRERALLHCLSVRPHFLDRMRQGVKLKTILGHWGPAEHMTAAESIHEYVTAENIPPVNAPWESVHGDDVPVAP